MISPARLMRQGWIWLSISEGEVGPWSDPSRSLNDAGAQAYTRLVLFIEVRRLWSIAGGDNPATLFAYLDAEPHGDVRQSHYLWYRLDKTTLWLSGSDTERPADFESIKSCCEPLENRHLLLRHMKQRHR